MSRCFRKHFCNLITLASLLPFFAYADFEGTALDGTWEITSTDPNKAVCSKTVWVGGQEVVQGGVGHGYVVLAYSENNQNGCVGNFSYSDQFTCAYSQAPDPVEARKTIPGGTWGGANSGSSYSFCVDGSGNLHLGSNSTDPAVGIIGYDSYSFTIVNGPVTNTFSGAFITSSNLNVNYVQDFPGTVKYSWYGDMPFVVP